MEFKGTSGKLELKYVNGICIGIGTVGDYSKITANTVLGHIDTDKQYAKEKVEIESNMLLYSKALEMLEMLGDVRGALLMTSSKGDLILADAIEQLIKEATEL